MFNLIMKTEALATIEQIDASGERTLSGLTITLIWKIHLFKCIYFVYKLAVRDQMLMVKTDMGSELHCASKPVICFVAEISVRSPRKEFILNIY